MLNLVVRESNQCVSVWVECVQEKIGVKGLDQYWVAERSKLALLICSVYVYCLSLPKCQSVKNTDPEPMGSCKCVAYPN